ncbi:MAG: helix-turn-helix transcriptional regulator [Clostridia bacterium]|nr:helix-turn-helix transcriptional regulator [Clostridia bacterium]
MQDKSTDDLRQELMESPDLEQYLAENDAFFSSKDAAAMLNQLFKKCGLSKAALAKRSGMSDIYLHQIFSGRRNPSRSRLLCLCIGLGASLEETQELLKLCGLAQLYPKLRRDAIIIYGLTHRLSLFSINDSLFSSDEETLF